MVENKDCTTHLLPDHPAQTDAFGSHDRVASGIADLVSSGDGGKSIALTGSWGSGKSTVVELLKLKDSPTKIFVFNAWTHEGDPLRRTFLEQLINFLDRQI